jgi:hypothetical protein
MKRMLAGLLTIIMIILMIGLGLRHSAPDAETTGKLARPAVDALSSDSRFPGASDRIEGLIASAHKGDVATYLAAFGGSLRARLEREAQELGWATFSARLHRAGQARKSHAIFAAEPDGRGPDTARISVETTYRDRLERQTYCLERTAGVWLVTDVETAHDVVPKNPLGSLATYQEPEGAPVAADLHN